MASSATTFTNASPRETTSLTTAVRTAATRCMTSADGSERPAGTGTWKRSRRLRTQGRSASRAQASRFGSRAANALVCSRMTGTSRIRATVTSAKNERMMPAEAITRLTPWRSSQATSGSSRKAIAMPRAKGRSTERSSQSSTTKISSSPTQINVRRCTAIASPLALLHPVAGVNRAVRAGCGRPGRDRTSTGPGPAGTPGPATPAGVVRTAGSPALRQGRAGC